MGCWWAHYIYACARWIGAPMAALAVSLFMSHKQPGAGFPFQAFFVFWVVAYILSLVIGRFLLHKLGIKQCDVIGRDLISLLAEAIANR